MRRLQVRLPEGLATRVQENAERSGVSSGEWIRRAIERALAEESAASDPLARLAELEAPTADIEQMLAEVQADPLDPVFGILELGQTTDEFLDELRGRADAP